MTATNEQQLLKPDIHLIDPSPYQSRKVFAPEKIREMMESILEHGIIQPLIVRRSPTTEGRFELVAGERRLRGAKEAGLGKVPVLLSEISDAAAEAMVLTENLQREDLTPAEEAHAFERLLKLKDAQGGALYTQAALAKMISKDVEYITARLKLLLCPEDLVKAVNEGLISVSTAMLVGRVPAAKAREKLSKLVLKPDTQEVPLNFEQTKNLIREQFMVKLDPRDFELSDPNLVPVKMEEGARCQGGACLDCPFLAGAGDDMSRNSATSTNEAKGKNKNLCTLPRCHRLKLDAHWREAKLKAEQAGKKTLDGKAAEKVFGGYNGGIAYDANYVSLDEEEWVGSTKVKPRTVLKGSDVKTTLAKHPETGKIVELIEKTALKAVVEAKKKEADGKPLTGKALQLELDAKEKRKEEIRQQKIAKLALGEGITEIRDALTQGRVKLDEALYSALFNAALDAAGSDGTKFLADTLGIERNKTAGSYGLDKPILAWVKTNVETAAQWLALLTVTMLSRRVAWNGVHCDHFRAVLALCGLKVPDLERRAKALLNGPKKGKGEVEPEKPAGGSKNSTDKTDWSAAGEASTSAAGDDRAKSGGIVRKVADYNCDCCNVPIHCPPGTGAKLSLIPKGELKCKKCGGEWENRFAGWKREGFNLMQHPTEHAAAIALGEWTYEDCIGHEPQALTGAHNKWKAARAKLEKAVSKLGKKGVKGSKTPPAVKHHGLQAAAQMAQDCGQADGFGPSTSEIVTGIQDSKIGKPGMWTPADYEAAGKLLNAGTHKVADLMGPTPNRKEKGKLTRWNAARVKLLRVAKQLKGK